MDFDPGNYGVTFGHLYNWISITISSKLSPQGWHILTQEE